MRGCSAPPALDEPPETGIFCHADKRSCPWRVVAATAATGIMALEGLAFSSPLSILWPEALDGVHDVMLP
jgi:hypothetical protein